MSTPDLAALRDALAAARPAMTCGPGKRRRGCVLLADDLIGVVREGGQERVGGVLLLAGQGGAGGG